MDQLRGLLKALKKYHFWLLCMVILATSFTTWSGATGRLAKEHDDKKRVLENMFKSTERISKDAQQPNATFVEGISELKQSHEKNIRNAWRMLYKQQANVFKLSEFLSETTRMQLEDELQSETPLPGALRRRYQNEVVRCFDELFREHLDVREREDDESDFQGLVVWPKTSRDALSGRYQWSGTPSDPEVRYSIEDYNIYREVLHAIDQVNAQSRDHLAAVVKGIVYLGIGQDATGRGERRGAAKGFLDTWSADAGEKGRGGRVQERTAPPGQPQQPTDAKTRMLTDGRYVDEQGLPLPAGAGHPVEFYKLMPLRLRLVVDQRQLPRVLAGFANARVPIEVLQLRFNPRGSFDPFQENAGGEKRNKRDREQWGAAGSGMEGLEPAFHDVEVELLAVMYLYTQPPEPAAEEVPEGQPGAEPADEPPAPETPETPPEPPADEPPAAETPETPAETAPDETPPATPPESPKSEAPADLGAGG